MSTVIVIDFTDQMGNLLPQFQINSVISDSDLNVLSGLLQNYVQVQNQIKIRIGTTPDNPIESAQQVYSHVVAAMNQIAFLAPNAGAGTTQTSSFVGQIPGQNVIFDIRAGNGLILNRVILSSTDYTLLVSNAQANVAVLNQSSTTLAPNLTYDRLETQIVASGVTSIPSSQSAGLTNTGSTSNYMVTVKNNSGTTKQFILNQSDYISLYQTQLNSIVSSSQTYSLTNATLSNVLSFIVTSTSSTPSPASTTPASSPTTSPTVTQTNSIASVVLEGETIPFGTYTVVAKNDNGTFNILGPNVTISYLTLADLQTLKNDGYTINDPNNILSAPTPPPGNVVIQGDPQASPTTPTGNQTTPISSYTNSQLAALLASQAQHFTTNQQNTQQSSQYNSLSQIKQNPIGFLVTLFTGGFAMSLIIPKLQGRKHLRSHRRNKK